jgi:NarL family two-component system sensor histidine kinase LiaS
MSIRFAFVTVAVVFTSIGSVVTLMALHWMTPIPWTGHELLVLSGVEFGLWVIAIWTAYRVVQPFRRRLYDLEEAATLIASGRLQHRLSTSRHMDEIGSVAEQFNKMSEKLENQVRALRRVVDENQHLSKETEQSAVLGERQRLARELHDSVSQQLFAISMLSASAQKQLVSQPARLHETLSGLEELANAAQREMRALLLHLRPVELQGRNFGDAADSFLNAVEERHGLKCTFECQVDRSLGASVEEQLFRILQEAVANVLKHAEASTILVRLMEDGPVIVLTILDDGKGIAEDDGDQSADAYGIRAMQERAVLLGGRLQMWRRKQGTAVEIQFPIVDTGSEA